ncbi:MAG: hypothetical protein NT022_10535, partial [Deltaproteobacteria bacterium]|nr:hypothetical protein [Deltaproteobacteria bacterium]
CPWCGGVLAMTGQSECSCACGHVCDPTVAFQVSSCCQARLIRRTFHYACSHCHAIVPSRFIFDEKLFDKDYFREMMQESRRRAVSKREELRRLLAESKSGPLCLMEEPDPGTLSGLFHDLDQFIQAHPHLVSRDMFELNSDFNMTVYRTHILTFLTHHTIRFSEVSPLMGDYRRDRVRRFITLVFMDNDQEIDIQQYGNDLLIQRRNNETYAEG